ncbi:MAG: hypothetical protein HN421_12295 [Gammaproteobacteria bacterium]|jgi:hypothetical protein|nr:hypothetical protein [Gammaproteobacteria bacterium]MBT4606013.1 hypothetical protein [Thiotrichales bacterium]MBT6303804.1 hypothetical protein [Candidatus Neomarinimicrobiota bacterium]MBT3717367.1 hypothetical protein [Gammaproteobacteria bacterium]MBT3845279.1 hypothetical protein [Gammaproteobacteria bacterium]
MDNRKIDINCFMELGRVLRAHSLDGRVLTQSGEIEVYDKYGNCVRKKFSDLLDSKESCTVCVGDITDHFEKLKFPSMRGAVVSAAVLRGG